MKTLSDGRWARIPLAASDGRHTHVSTQDTPWVVDVPHLGVKMALARSYGTREPLVLHWTAAHGGWAAVRATEAAHASTREALERLILLALGSRVEPNPVQPALFTL